MKFTESFKKFITGDSKRIQPFYKQINDTYLKRINVKTFTLSTVEKSVNFFQKFDRFNVQVSKIFKNDRFNSVCFYNQKGSVSVFSFFDFEKLDNKIIKIEDFLDEIKKTKKVYETVEILVEKQ